MKNSKRAAALIMAFLLMLGSMDITAFAMELPDREEVVLEKGQTEGELQADEESAEEASEKEESEEEESEKEASEKEESEKEESEEEEPEEEESEEEKSEGDFVEESGKEKSEEEKAAFEKEDFQGDSGEKEQPVTVTTGDAVGSFIFDTVDGGKANDRANGKPKVLFFFPIEENSGSTSDGFPGLMQNLYWGFGMEVLYNGKYMDTLVLDTKKSTKSAVKTARSKATNIGNYGGDKVACCYDTGAGIQNALQAYCEEAGITCDPALEYYFLLSEENELICFNYTGNGGIISADLEAHELPMDCLEWIRENIKFRSDIPAAQDLKIDQKTRDYAKLTWSYDEKKVYSYTVYYSYRKQGASGERYTDECRDTWTIQPGGVGYVNGEPYDYLKNGKVTYWFDRNKYINDYADDPEDVEIYVVPKDYSMIESKNKSNTVNLKDVKEYVDPEAYQKAEIIDEEGNVLNEITLHAGESRHLRLMLTKNSGESFIVGPEKINNIQWYADGDNGSQDPGFEFYRSKIYDKTNTYIRGKKPTQGLKTYVVVTLPDITYLEKVMVPVTVLPAESGVTYPDYEQKPADVLDSLTELEEKIKNHLNAKDTSTIRVYIKESLMEDYKSEKGYDWDILDTVFHLYDGQEDVELWGGDYLFAGQRNLDIDWMQAGFPVNYQGISYTPIVFEPDYRRIVPDENQKVSLKIDALVNQPSGALYKYRDATAKQKADACTDWIRKNVSYIGTTNDFYHSAYSALYEKRATCEGYSLLLWRLLKALGVHSRMIGTKLDSNGNAHAFSIVMLDDGKYYYYDATGGIKCQYEGQFAHSFNKGTWADFYTGEYLQGLGGYDKLYQKVQANIISKLATSAYKEPTGGEYRITYSLDGEEDCAEVSYQAYKLADGGVKTEAGTGRNLRPGVSFRIEADVLEFEAVVPPDREKDYELPRETETGENQGKHYITIVYDKTNGQKAEVKVYENSEKKYVIDLAEILTANNSLTVKIATKIIENEEEKTVVINNTSSFPVTVQVVEGEVVRADGMNSTYSILKGAKYFQFSVKADSTKKLNLMVGGQEAGKGDWTYDVSTNTYSFKKFAKDIDDGTVFRVQTESVKKKITVDHNPDEAIVSGTVDGALLAPATAKINGKDTAYFEVETGKTVCVTVTPKKNCRITEMTVDGGTAGIINKNGIYTFSKKTGDNDSSVIVRSRADCAAVLVLDGKAEKNTQGYRVSYHSAPFIELEEGIKSRGIDAYRIMEGNTVLEDSTASDYREKDAGAALISGVCVSGNQGTVMRLALKEKGLKAWKGKTIRVILYVYEKKDSTYVEKANLTLAISTEAKTAQITGISNTAALAIGAGITGTVKAAGREELADLCVKVKDVTNREGQNLDSTEYTEMFTVSEIGKDGKFTLTAKSSDKLKAGYKVTVQAYNEQINEWVEDAVAKVTITDAAVTNKELTAGIVSSTDRKIKVKVSVPKNVPDLADGKLFYNFVVNSESTAATIRAALKKYRAADELDENDDSIRMYFVSKEDVDAQGGIVELTVNTSEPRKKEDFQVEVRLVQVPGGVAYTGTGKDLHDAVIAESRVKELSAGTKVPAYAAKLTLKKINGATVYTGQTDAAVATVEFDKNATYTTATVELVNTGTGIKADGTDAGITLRLDEGTIRVSVAKNKMAGFSALPTNYGVRVIAATDAGAYAASGIMPLKFVCGIEDIEVPVPETLYKENGKQATLKLAPIYNYVPVQIDGVEHARKAPKTKKAVYKLIANGGHEIPAGVSINEKTGAIKVDKGYILKGGEEDTFRVEVTAADYAGNETKTITNAIRIVNTRLAMDQMVLVKYDDHSDKYHVIARGGNTVPSIAADKLAESQNITVRVLKPGQAESNVYTEDAFVDTDNYKLTSSNKAAVPISDGGRIHAVKTAKNVTLTATASDSSKSNKVTMKLNVVYSDAELGIRVSRVVDDHNENEQNRYEDYDVNASVVYKDTANVEFKVTVMEKSGNEWKPSGSDYQSNFVLKITGATVTDKGIDSKGKVQHFVVNKGEAKITLTDKGSKKTKEIKITNNGYCTNAAPTIKTSDKLTAGSYDEPQTLTYRLSGNYNYEGKSVKIGINRAKKEDKLRFSSFAAAPDGSIVLPVSPDGTFEIKLGYLNNGSYELDASNYYMTAAFGTMDGEDFVPDTKDVALAFKPDKPKSLSSKITVPGTIKILPSGEKSLIDIKSDYPCRLMTIQGGTYKEGASEGSYAMNEMKNGRANGFRNCFEITEESGKYYLKLKAGVDASTVKAEDMTGYITVSNGCIQKDFKIKVSFLSQK